MKSPKKKMKSVRNEAVKAWAVVTKPQGKLVSAYPYKIQAHDKIIRMVFKNRFRIARVEIREISPRKGK